MIEFSDIQITLTTILAACGGITIIAGAAKATAPLLHPFKKIMSRIGSAEERLDKHDKFFDSDKKRLDALESLAEASAKANLALLHNQLYESCTHHLAAGIITIDDLDNLKCVYDAYHALGGNGTGTQLYERCKALRLKEVDEERQEMRRMP